ncbi:MAG: polysaccharide deacetylase family protein [Acidobacteriia bacterium]|nr:polysaccharide deacetylase family protein [Terriglobia bacterium]
MNPSTGREISAATRPRVVVTTSWDDDAASGMRVAELLGERGLRGTFYVPTGQLNGGSRFTSGNLRTLCGNGFEIGAHTISHRILPDLTPAELVQEVGGCKAILEQMLGQEVTTFCYPRGRFNPQVVAEVQRAGYRGARTTRMLCSDAAFSPLEMPTTVQAYPHTRSNYVRNLGRLGGVSALARSAADLLWFDNWLQLGKKLFDRTVRDGGVWHVYGHPWEIEKLNLWSQLEEILDYVSHRDGVTYLTNAQLLQWTKSENEAGDGQAASNREHSMVH